MNGRDEGMSENKIITWQVFPPIPTNKFDWAAYYDGFEEGCYGWGETEELAIIDLKSNCEIIDERKATP